MRLMTLNLSSSYPLEAINRLYYTFYKCPSDVLRIANLTAIGCMSNSSISTVATRTVSSQVMKKLYRCDEIVTSDVPVSAFDDSHDFIGNQSDFFLRWGEVRPQEVKRWVPDYIVGVTSFLIPIVTVITALAICIACCAHFGRMLRKNDA
ncbi:putative RING-H2 finger protein atl21a [Phtheirospermum japonicum]|uniref:Putative RING-H2 finger protein atl21a n=1 Tax=Phtheirospermum japonicum TaxID=374723 RepID=A0A830BWT8_9LAMI|nr:putative RING-H2 finger protein atl21a [Phtheirospermum japonicum]